jgi:hypothetical protein
MRRFFPIVFAVIFALAGALPACGQVALLMEEPFAKFGRFNPTGHAAIYLPRVCAETPVMLRRCEPGELGVVISRYHRVGGYDWIAMPLVPYLYAVDDVKDIPKTANRSLEAELRDAYRREHLQDLVPDGPNGATPKGEWTQLVGSSYDRKIYGFEIPTTVEQDDQLIEELNTSENRADFNLLSQLRGLYPLRDQYVLLSARDWPELDLGCGDHDAQAAGAIADADQQEAQDSAAGFCHSAGPRQHSAQHPDRWCAGGVCEAQVCAAGRGAASVCCGLAGAGVPGQWSIQPAQKSSCAGCGGAEPGRAGAGCNRTLVTDRVFAYGTGADASGHASVRRE